MNNSDAAIITFYSYKGGVGRSMALANVAWLLATKYGKKVLVVDWDLEAPGLHRFFGIGNRTIKRGLIELLDEYKTLLKEETDKLPKHLIDIDKYIISIPLPEAKDEGSLSIIASGQQDSTYASRVNQFDWDEFYSKWQGFGFIEYLKQELKSKANLVLLDSRTGVTDIGGICTLQLPDVVVLMFALNEQNIAGAEFIAESIIKKAPELEKRENAPILILRPSRVEKYLELERKKEWEIVASRRLEQYLLPKERKDSLRIMKENAIPYVGAYSFGETLAVENDPHEELSKSFDALAKAVLQAASMWTNNELDEIDTFQDRFYFSRRRISYFFFTYILKNKLLTVSVAVLTLVLQLAVYLNAERRKAEEEQRMVEAERVRVQQQLETKSQLLENQINELKDQNLRLNQQNKELNDRMDQILNRLVQRPR